VRREQLPPPGAADVHSRVTAHTQIRASASDQCPGVGLSLHDRDVATHRKMEDALGGTLMLHGARRDVPELIAFRAELTHRRDHHEVVGVQPGQRDGVPGSERVVPCRVDRAQLKFQVVPWSGVMARYGAATDQKGSDPPVGTHLYLGNASESA